MFIKKDKLPLGGQKYRIGGLKVPFKYGVAFSNVPFDVPDDVGKRFIKNKGFKECKGKEVKNNG